MGWKLNRVNCRTNGQCLNNKQQINRRGIDNENMNGWMGDKQICIGYLNWKQMDEWMDI